MISVGRKCSTASLIAACSGRNDHEVERIGKKYQWLASYELMARMGDNLEPLPDQWEDGPDRLRNIDPSMLRERTEDDGWQRFNQASFWVVSNPKLEKIRKSVDD